MYMNDTGINAAAERTKRVSIPEDHVSVEPGERFVRTAYVEELTNQALAYLKVGYPVHFSGSAGTGKTTLAFHIAAKLGRPVILIHGDDEFGSSDLIGKDSGYSRYKLVDNYIHSVVKSEEHMNTLWTDNRLTSACQKGYTLIYDEFTRSRPEANNPFLSVLEEGILNLPGLRWSGEGYLRVHPDFRAIFTSNPEEYAGVHKTQDALMDRLITITIGHYDRDSEVQIAMAKSGLSHEDAEAIVDIVRNLRGIDENNRPTIRASIAIARITAHTGAKAQADDQIFRRICKDVLNINTAKVPRGRDSITQAKMDNAINKVCKEHKLTEG
jgi:nitric oxide reductase NorQ protein